MILNPEPLTPEAFQPFGELLQTDGRPSELINRGLTRKFAALSFVRVDEAARVQLCLYRSAPAEMPFRIRELERHPLASQAFIPLHARPFPVVVASGSGRPSVADLRIFLTNGRQGINLRPGIWHHHQLTLDRESDYLVVERDREEGNLEICRLAGEAILQF